MNIELFKDQEYLEKCLAGEDLLGNDFSPEDIRQWYDIEENAYANQYHAEVKDDNSGAYGKHELNHYHGFKYLPDRIFDYVLSVGGACCYELMPLYDRLTNIIVLEPGDKFIHQKLHKKKLNYVKPDPLGVMPFPDEYFDLITCLDVLHHIPNVAYLISEMGRVLKPGGYLLLNEPLSSMGVWFTQRKGLTPLERGIPVKLMKRYVNDAKLELLKTRYCCFAPLSLTCSKLRGGEPYNNKILVKLDYLLSVLFSCNTPYSSKNALQKIRPGNCYYVISKL